MEQKLNITTDNEEITIRTGQAPVIQVNNKIGLKENGSIDSVSKYILSKKRLEDIIDNECYIRYSKSGLYIQLIDGYKNEINTDITGTISKSEKISVWGINQDKKFSSRELLKLVKRNKLSFENKQQYQELTLKLKKFSVKVESIIEDENDNRGKEKILIQKQADTDVPESFALKTPVFTGEKIENFNVEIYYDIVGSNIEFYLESVDLCEIEEKAAEEIFNRELLLIEDFDCPKIEK